MSAELSPPPEGNVDHGWQLLVAATVTFGFASLVVALRTFARIKHRRLGWDDHLMIFALVSETRASRSAESLQTYIQYRYWLSLQPF